MAHTRECFSLDTFWQSEVGVCRSDDFFLEHTIKRRKNNGQGALILSWLFGKGQRSTEQKGKGSFIQSDNESGSCVLGICRTFGPCPALPEPRYSSFVRNTISSWWNEKGWMFHFSEGSVHNWHIGKVQHSANQIIRISHCWQIPSSEEKVKFKDGAKSWSGTAGTGDHPDPLKCLFLRHKKL